jgi:uncharacterized membrane protein HdeD (DUF308 family)
VDLARHTAPWREGQSWWVAGVEGIVALLIGIYVVADPVRASDLVRQLIALVLLVVSLAQIVDGFRFRALPAAPWSTLRGGVGATVAVLTLSSVWSDYIQPTGARQMLAVGLLAYGIIGLVSLIFTLRATSFKVTAIIIDLLTIVLGILLLTASPEDTTGAQLLGAAAVVAGVALLIYAYSLWNRPERRAKGERDASPGGKGEEEENVTQRAG